MLTNTLFDCLLTCQASTRETVVVFAFALQPLTPEVPQAPRRRRHSGPLVFLMRRVSGDILGPLDFLSAAERRRFGTTGFPKAPRQRRHLGPLAFLKRRVSGDIWAYWLS